MSGKRSKGALKAFLADDSETVVAQAPDPRTTQLQAIGSDDAAALSIIRDLFAGTGLPDDNAKVRRILRVRVEVQKEWGDARDSFLGIGRALLSLEADLTRAEFQRLRQGSDRLFPFSDATATQLRQIARAVDSGKISADACPGSYGTAYQLTLLTEAQMRVALHRGLIRPDVTRREIMQLRQEVQQAEGKKEPRGRLDRSALRVEQKRLLARRERLSSELDAVDQRLAALNDLFSGTTESAA